MHFGDGRHGTGRKCDPCQFWNHQVPVAPIGYVQGRNAQHKRKSVNKYTPEGLELIHKNLNIGTKTMLWLMRNPVQDRPIEYADNRIFLYRVT